MVSGKRVVCGAVGALALLGLLWLALYLFVPGHGAQDRVFFGCGNGVISDFALVRAFTMLPDPYVGIEGYDRAEACYTYFAFDLLRLFPNTPGGGWVNAVLGAMLLVWSLLVFGGLRRNNVWRSVWPVVFVVSAPMLFTIDRQNLALYSTAAVVVFVMWYDANDRIRRAVAALALAVAVVLKISPVLFGILYLLPAANRRRPDWLGALTCALVTFILLVVPFLASGDGLASMAKWLRNAVEQNGNHQALTTWGFIAVRRGLELLGVLPSFISLMFSRVLSVGLGLMAFGATVLPTTSRQAPGSTRMLLLASSLMLLPANAYFYVSLYLLPGFVLWALELRSRAATLWDVGVGVCLVAIFQPLQIPAELIVEVQPGLTLNYQLENFAFMALTILLVARVVFLETRCRGSIS